MTEPLDWTTDMQASGDFLDPGTDPALALDPDFVAIDDATASIDVMTEFVIDEPAYEWVEVSTDDVVDVTYDWSAESDWLVIDPAVPLDPG